MIHIAYLNGKRNLICDGCGRVNDFNSYQREGKDLCTKCLKAMGFEK